MLCAVGSKGFWENWRPRFEVTRREPQPKVWHRTSLKRTSLPPCQRDKGCRDIAHCSRAATAGLVAAADTTSASSLPPDPEPESVRSIGCTGSRAPSCLQGTLRRQGSGGGSFSGGRGAVPLTETGKMGRGFHTWEVEESGLDSEPSVQTGEVQHYW